MPTRNKGNSFGYYSPEGNNRNDEFNERNRFNVDYNFYHNSGTKNMKFVKDVSEIKQMDSLSRDKYKSGQQEGNL